MILRIMGLEDDIIFDDCHDTLLVINDSQFYASIINRLNLISNGIITSNDIVLLENDTNISSNIEVVLDLFNLTLNSRKILSALYKMLETEISSDEMFMYFHRSIEEVNSIVEEYTNDLNIEYTYKEEVSFSDYLKFIDLTIEENTENTLKEKVINYLEIYSELFPNKIFIFCNVLSYFSKEDIMSICKYKNYKHITTLFIENRDTTEHSFQKYIVDNDLYLYKK